MTGSLFDLPTPLLAWIDERLTGFLPVPLAILIWSVIGAVLCLELYRLCSPQARIARIRREAGAAQERLSSFDGEFDEAWPLIRNLLGLSLKRVALVLPATLIGAYPVVALLVWLGNSYGYALPEPGEAVVPAVPAPLVARWLDGNGIEPARIQALQADGSVALEVDLLAASPVIHKREWWNWLFANPAGYLPDDAPVDEIRTGLSRREMLAAGPRWLRGWEAFFLPGLILAALAYKHLRRIH